MTELGAIAAGNRAKAVLWILLQTGVSLVSCALVVFSTLSAAGCGDGCDYGTLSFAVHSAFTVCGGAFVASIASLILLRRRPLWWLPAIATGVVILWTVVAVVLVHIATHP
ncbi:hypothetical protein ITJ43_10185 [Microbacterium sp. VKM Ac-2870]|uniref:hypothetical protein n=1 Tax=Microbacterium sp. VKM Ac-2870 TaxID=2783825 RepID=UPI00188D844F|nr:hypothetical protein [Microbacterium sp. VKM Ac-2870]MBF4562512.1 hypothetical protein [Microbacterium sp. VKM Ac-2870]